jgi:hypothetical protein
MLAACWYLPPVAQPENYIFEVSPEPITFTAKRIVIRKVSVQPPQPSVNGISAYGRPSNGTKLTSENSTSNILLNGQRHNAQSL